MIVVDTCKPIQDFFYQSSKSQSSNQKTWQNNSKYISYEKDKSIKEILFIENNTTP